MNYNPTYVVLVGFLTIVGILSSAFPLLETVTVVAARRLSLQNISIDGSRLDIIILML